MLLSTFSEVGLYEQKPGGAEMEDSVQSFFMV
jgi:hypothetical protein